MDIYLNTYMKSYKTKNYNKISSKKLVKNI